MIALRSTWGRILTFPILASLLITATSCAQDEPELAASESAAIPDSPLGDQLTWILGVFESGGQGVTEAEVSEHLTETFLEEVPPDRFLGIVVQVASELNPFKLESFEVGPTETHAVAILRNEQDEPFRLTMTVESDPPHLIAGALIKPAPDLDQSAGKTWEAVDKSLQGAAASVGFLAAEVRDGDCKPIHQLEPDVPLAIGSAFKLYVLGALAEEIETGTASWDERLAIQEDLKSIPSGDMRDQEPGTEFKLQHFAREMISVSDNTATDHLLDRVARERVESIQRTMGNVHARMNVPFLSTRELTILKFSDDREVTDYLVSNTEGRRRLLSSEIADASLPEVDDLAGWSEPKHIDSLEWFASPADLCRAMAWLEEASGRPGLRPISEILETDAGNLGADADTWTYAGFKGGSEPGVLNVTAILRRKDGRWFFVSVGLNDPNSNVDGRSAQGALTTALDLLAR